MKRDYKVYMITNLVNGKIYIGQTCRTIKDRWGNHIWTSQNTGSKSLLHKAIQKYGENDFNIEIIATCKTKEEINHKEIEMIHQYNSKSPNGYNLTDGGEGKHGIRWTEEQFKKRKKYKATMSEAHKGLNTWSKGRKLSDDHKRKISEATKGKKKSPRHLQKTR